MDEVQRAANQKQLRDDVKAEFARRREIHRLKIAQLKAGARRRALSNLASQNAPLQCYAVADSWFDYPLNDYGVLWPNQDIVAQLQSLGNPPPVINSRAVHGQAMNVTMGLANQQEYVTDLTDDLSWTDGKPDAILVSGGGDDIVGDPFVLYLDYNGGGLDVNRLEGVLDTVVASYKALFAFRDKWAPQTPIIGHCYDYAIPNGAAVFVAGPWLKPSLDFEGYTYAQGLNIVTNMINQFYDALRALAADPSNSFTLVDTRGTLTRDTSHPLGWANEIHPYTAGFVALAQKFVPALSGLFPGRI